MSEQYQHPEQRNLITKLFPKEDARKKIAAKAIAEFEADLKSGIEFEEMQAEWLDLYFQRHTTSQPFEGASTESIPMVLEACSQFHARAMKVIFRSDDIIRVIPTEHVDDFSRDRANRLSQHMRYTVFRKIRNYKRDKDALLQAIPLRGSMFTKVYADPIYGFARVKNLRPSDLILPYGVGPRAMEDIPRKTERLWVPHYAVQRLVRSGFFAEEPSIYRTGSYINAYSEVDKVADEAMGIQEPYDVEDYCFLIEQHTWLDVTGDGWKAPVVLWIDPVGYKVVRLTIGYETDEAGVPTDPNAAPIEAYTHYQYMPNPDGVYGLGHGHLLADINIAANRLLRTIIDSAVLASVSGMSGFVDQRATGGKHEIALELGKFKPIPALESLKNGIWTPTFPGPNPALVNIMEWITGRGDRLGMVTDLVTGTADKVMQPTAVMQLLQQSDVIFSSAQERFLSSWEHELRNIYDFNSKFLPPEEYFSVMDVEHGDYQLQQVYAADYTRDFKVIPSISRASSDQEKLAQSDAEFQTLQMFPQIQGDPNILYNILKRRIEALGCSPMEEVVPPRDQWLMAWQNWLRMQGAQLESELQIQDDKQEHDTEEKRKDRTHEEKMLKMEIEAKHEDEKVKAEALKVKAKADAEVTKAVGNVKVANEKIKGQEIRKDAAARRTQRRVQRPSSSNKRRS